MALTNDDQAKPSDASFEIPGTGLRARRARTPGVDPHRDLLIVEVVDELTSWNPRERMSAFKSWLKGSLSLIHLHVLTILEADGPVPMSRLADALDVSVASATGIVGRMEERELVERRHDSEDRRVVMVVPTEAGVSVFRDMLDQRREHLKGVLGRLDERELQSFLIGLRAMHAARAAVHAESVAAASTPVSTAARANETPPAAGVDDAPADPREGTR